MWLQCCKTCCGGGSSGCWVTLYNRLSGCHTSVLWYTLWRHCKECLTVYWHLGRGYLRVHRFCLLCLCIVYCHSLYATCQHHLCHSLQLEMTLCKYDISHFWHYLCHRNTNSNRHVSNLSEFNFDVKDLTGRRWRWLSNPYNDHYHV